MPVQGCTLPYMRARVCVCVNVCVCVCERVISRYTALCTTPIYVSTEPLFHLTNTFCRLQPILRRARGWTVDMG